MQLPTANIPHKTIYDTRLSPRVFRLYTLLKALDIANTHIISPGRQNLAEILKCSVSTLDRGLIRLQKAGYVVVDRRGKTLANIIHLLNTPHITPEHVREVIADVKAKVAKSQQGELFTFDNKVPTQ